MGIEEDFQARQGHFHGSRGEWTLYLEEWLFAIVTLFSSSFPGLST